MAKHYKETTIVCYRVENGSEYPLYEHPKCLDEDFPGEALFPRHFTVDRGRFYLGSTDASDLFCHRCGQRLLTSDVFESLEAFLKSRRSLQEITHTTPTTRAPL
jgi:hypothetical protein